jgi:molecular chaperone HscB
MVDPFDTLGITAELDVDLSAVEQRYRDLSRVLHPDRHVAGSPSERRMSLGKAVEVNEAWRVVRDPIRRAEALFQRHGVTVSEGAMPRAAPEFLMVMMEEREALSDARAAKDAARVRKLAEKISGQEQGVWGRLVTGFRAHGEKGEDLAKLVPLLGELRYYRRFLDEVSAIEDELP